MAWPFISESKDGRVARPVDVCGVDVCGVATEPARLSSAICRAVGVLSCSLPGCVLRLCGSGLCLVCCPGVGSRVPATATTTLSPGSAQLSLPSIERSAGRLAETVRVRVRATHYKQISSQATARTARTAELVAINSHRARAAVTGR